MAGRVGCIRIQEEVDKSWDLSKDYSFILPFLRNPYSALNDLLAPSERHLHVTLEEPLLPLGQKDSREEVLLRFSNISE